MVVNHLRHLFRRWTFLTGSKGSHNLEPQLTMGTNQVQRWDDPPGGPGKLDGEPANFGKAAAGRVRWPMQPQQVMPQSFQWVWLKKCRTNRPWNLVTFCAQLLNHQFLGALLSQSHYWNCEPLVEVGLPGRCLPTQRGRAAIRVQRISGLPQAFWDSHSLRRPHGPSIPSFWIFQAFSSGCIWIWVQTPQTRLCLYWKSCCLNGRSSPIIHNPYYQWIGLRFFYKKTPYFMRKSMVSCNVSLKPIHLD